MGIFDEISKGAKSIRSAVVNTIQDPAEAIGAAGREYDRNTVQKIFGNDFFGNKAAADKRNELLNQIKDHEVTSKSSVENTSSQQTTFDPKSSQEKSMLDQSIRNYNQQGRLASQFEQGLARKGELQAQGQDILGNIASGQAFDLTQGEMGRINSLRNAELSQSRNAMDSLLNERLAQLEADSARRGVRGQAYSQLQGDVLGESAKSFERQMLESNRLAAQRQNDAVQQRVGIQSQVGGQMATMQDQATQQAIANRSALQDPVALQMMRDERLRGGKTTTSNTTNTTGSTKGAGFAGAATKFAGAPNARQGNFSNIVGLGAAGAKAYAGFKGIPTKKELAWRI